MENFEAVGGFGVDAVLIRVAFGPGAALVFTP